MNKTLNTSQTLKLDVWSSYLLHTVSVSVWVLYAGVPFFCVLSKKYFGILPRKISVINVQTLMTGIFTKINMGTLAI